MMCFSGMSVLFALIAIEMGGYAFWRHDAWGYVPDKWLDLRENLRWLAPFLHMGLSGMPNPLAWVLSMGLLYYVALTFGLRFVSGTDLNRMLVAAFAFLAVINPAVVGQLGWPVHSFAALLLLSIGAWFTRRHESLVVMVVSTIIVSAVLQGVAFLALFFAVPSFVSSRLLPVRRIMIRSICILLLWALAVLVAYLLGRLSQLIAFGEMAPFPDWRLPNPARSAADLLRNFLVNVERFDGFMTRVYDMGEFWVLLAPVMVVAWASWRVNRSQSVAIVSTALLAVFLASAPYIFTIPIGTYIPERTNVGLGLAVMLLCLLLLVWVKENAHEWSGVISALILAAMIYHPFSTSYRNTAYFSQVTRDIVSSIEQLAQMSQVLGPELIVIKAGSGELLWPVDYSTVLAGRPLMIEGFSEEQRIARAFETVGYKEKLLWCTEATRRHVNDARCDDEADRIYVSCATANPAFCSAPYDRAKAFWYLRM